MLKNLLTRTRRSREGSFHHQRQAPRAQHHLRPTNQSPDSHNQFDDTDGDSQLQGEAELTIETPSIEDLEEAESQGKVRVFACHTALGAARIALSFEKAIKDVKNAEVQVINSESTLLDNLAVVEVRLRKDMTGKHKSLADRLAEARARAG